MREALPMGSAINKFLVAERRFRNLEQHIREATSAVERARLNAELAQAYGEMELHASVVAGVHPLTECLPFAER
jgi:hypothetical protein